MNQLSTMKLTLEDELQALLLMKQAQSRQKSYYGHKHRPLEFAEGEHAFVRLSPVTGVGRAHGVRKLSPRFIDLYQVIERVGPVAYQLALPPQLSGIHDVFHVSQLRRYIRDESHVVQPDEVQIQDNLKTPTMSSSSSSNHRWVYDVFLNFRGEDTRDNIVSHLYASLSNAGINTYIDDELPKGKKLESELFRAIKKSQIALVVFSERYSESSWCLMELEQIMERYQRRRQVVVPIFYGVDPSVVRKQTGEFGEVLEKLAKQKKLSGTTLDKVVRGWRRALTRIANLSGWDMKNCRSEAELVKKIVHDVLSKLDNGLLSITDFPVGLESRLQEVIGLIENQSSKVCMVGIWGMGGSGKTTTAKAIYNKTHRKFVHKSFIENIREVCERDSRGHIDLQQQLLSDVLKAKVEIHSIAMGTTMIEKRLCGRRALFVFDDVTKFEQLKALCGHRKWIGKGSVIIITTRDMRLLTELKVDCVCRMKEMDKNESLELFSWHAFGQASPVKYFTELSQNVVAYCGGLPLALEVLGSYLYERTKQEWESVLSKLEIIPNDQVQEKLRISFDGLGDQMEKDIFLDICCFFIGKDRSYVTEILNGCGLHADIGITVLIERSLIKVEKNNKLGMHDLLRDMGREIVRQTSPEEPEERSRLWVHEDVLDVLTQHTGTQAIQGLAFKLQGTSRVCFHTKAFEKMKRLRLLQLDCVKLDGDYEYLSKLLRWVCWQRFPLKYIPDNFYLGKAVAINLKHSNLYQVWKEPQLLEGLKFLNLSHSRYLTNTPDFSKLPNLEKLILKDCTSLSEVHQSIGDLSKLLLINLKDCKSLSNLPRRIYELKSVKTLILSGCSKIDKLEEDIVQMESLTTLIANNTAVKQVPFSIIRSKSVGYISLCGYEGLTRDVFPSLIWSWMSPTMNPLSSIPPFRGMSSSLVSMNLHINNLGSLSPMLKNLSKLRCVCVNCISEFQLTQGLRRILDDLCDVNFPEMETTSYASQISNLSLRSLLIGMGSCHMVMDTLGKSISQGLTNNGSSDYFLPGDNCPNWLAYTAEGHSVFFQVPEDSDRPIKGMILCVIYSSTTENKGVECLISVLIINYTKCTIHVYKRDTAMSFNDEDWQGVKSNLGAGDNVEIFVAFRHGVIVKKTAVYLIYGQSIVKIEQSIRMEIEPSPKVKREPSLMSNKNIFTILTKRMRECLCLNRN
ncbi:disease resistance protein RUN1-like [Gastrolobium bilobum]|uniref:disease resistance protein RUN1-like n=1 Tax=Gastrolobium bilobum TaxID=150636 RepID=UPI002AB2EE0A|nr:disease resistance protein RUN1-like [Gastrolobium bilobum]